MSIKDCAQEILEAAKAANQELLPDEVSDILNQLEKKIKNRGRRVLGRSDFEALINEATEISRQAKINAAIMKRNKLIDARVYTALNEKINQFPKGKGGKVRPAEALSAILVGTNKITGSGRFSIDAQAKSIEYEYGGALASDLAKNDMLRMFESGQLDELVYRELFDGFGSTGDKNARKIAESVQKMQKALLRRKNRAGAFIGELENYAVRQSHDSALLRRAGYEQWKADIYPKLNIQKTFKDLQPDQTEDDFLRAAYDGLVTGIHLKGTGENVVKTSANLAKRLSQSRTLHFRNGADAYAYSKQYSRMNFSEQLLSSLSSDSQSLSLMENLGTNPKNMLDRIVEEQKAKYRGDPTIVEALESKRISNQFKELDGSMRGFGAGSPILGSLDLGSIASSFRMIKNMAALGSATISSFGDIASKATFINQNTERGLLGSYATALNDVFNQFGKKDQKQLSYILGVGFENWIGDVHARHGANDSGVGKLSKAHQLFFKLNGMRWWNNAQKTGMARMLSADLATYKNRAYSGVPKETTRLLGLYGIGETEWNLIRSVETKAADGRDYITPNAIDDLTNDLIDPVVSAKEGNLNVTDTMRLKYKDELKTKLSAYFVDSADSAIPTPGARERAIMNQGHERGTVVGEALRLFAQFKSFPITILTKGMGRASATGGVVAMAQMFIGMTVLGYAAMSVKDILRGREPLNIFNPDNWKDGNVLISAMLQGGGLGIYGDFLFGRANDYGGTFTTTLLGPAAQTADDLYDLTFETIEKGFDFGDVLKNIYRNTPFINLFWTKAAFDYLIYYGIMEKAQPGFLRRMEKRAKRDGNQEYFLPPSQNAVRY